MLSQSEKLHKAWDLKESFIDFRKAKTRETAEKELLYWILQAEESGCPNLQTLSQPFTVGQKA